MIVATNWLPAVAVVRQNFRFIPNADLLHFNTRLEVSYQQLNQLAEINAFFGHEVHNHSLPAKQSFYLDQLHVES